MSDPPADPAAWVGRTARAEDIVTAGPRRRLAAALGLDAPPGDVPILWHWLYLLDATPASDLGDDGHPHRGGFLPPVAGRRMWTGGRVEVHQPLRDGDAVERLSTVAAVEPKQGRHGALVVVTVRHQIHGPAGLAVAEEQDLVYASARPAAPRAGGGRPPAAAWAGRVVTDTVLLFRFSALTFNGHRIHYDAEYARTEGYPGLVVHGPLLAMLLAGLAAEHGVRPRRLWWRARAPFSCGEPIHLRGSAAGDLSAYSDSGARRVEAGFS